MDADFTGYQKKNKGGKQYPADYQGHEDGFGFETQEVADEDA
jgi:hypothetical protein